MKPVLQGSHVFADRMKTEVRDLGFMDYAEAHEIQLQSLESQLNGKAGEPCGNEVILITEHPSVFTLGRKGCLSGLIKSQAEVEQEGVKILHTERGGDITYHGPGQIVVYPIINLRKRKLSVTGFIDILEEIMINTAKDFEVTAFRDKRNRGIWVGNNKLGSVGIRIRHGITFHGLALNVNLSLEPFGWIQPCGLAGVGVTSIKQETGNTIDIEDVKVRMRHHIDNLLLA